MREFHLITFETVQSGEIPRGGQKECQRVERTNRKKVENIGNSYFPALAGPLFAS